MKKLIVLSAFSVFVSMASAQVVSCASFLKARQKADVVVPYRYLDEGVETPIEWGLDLAWLDEGNIRRGVNYVGKDMIDIVRTSFRASESVEDGALSADQIDFIQRRASIIKNNIGKNVSLNINDDHGDPTIINSWYNEYAAGAQGRGQRWAKVIDLTIQKYKALGLTNIVSISPFNEPDYGWGQGYSNSTRKGDFLNIAKCLKEDFDGAYDNVRICGGNTLNPDYAYEWWNYLKAYLDEGNTHQLAGTFDNYASFFQRVRAHGHHATADELHNTMEAMVGVEYGMQTGIWWGTCEHSRSQFMKATWHKNPGRRLAYAEHRNNWTAASVYRLPDGRVQAFGGTSERQGLETSYNLVSLDCPVWYNGERGREYMLTLPGGTGYQTGQSNAETVVDVEWTTDPMPKIEAGTYKIVNAASGFLMGFTSAPSGNWTSTSLRRNSNQKYMLWDVAPVPVKCGDDFSYYSFSLNSGANMKLDLLNWGLDAGTDVGAFPGSMGGNEQWFLEYAGKGAFYIRSRHSAKYLEAKTKYVGANILMADYTGEKNQQWIFVPSNVTPELTAPNAPTNLQTTSQRSSVSLEWTASTSKDVASYTVLRSHGGDNFYAIANGLTGTTFTDNEAQDGVEYSYSVYAVDKCYNQSEATEAVKATATGENDCVMCLPFEYTLNDTTLNGNHCAVYGDVKWTNGKVDAQALQLNGTSDFVQLPYTVASHDELTIACWVYWRGGNNWQRLWDFGNGTNQYMFFSPKSDNGMRFAIKNGGDEQQIRSSKNLAMNRWVHVAVTLGADGAILYVDGEQQGANKSVDIKGSDINPVLNYIGRSQFLADPTFKGNVDDFRIYNYVLSADEVKALADMTDDIRVVTETSESLQTDVYNLSGIRMTPSNKGIVVKKGKKVLIK